MLKFMGMLLILAGAGGFGRYFIIRLNMHFEQLIECREIFAQMDAERQYLRLPYAQLLRKTARGRQAPFADMLCAVAKEMEKNDEADAGALWERAFLEQKGQLLLREDEKCLCFALAKSLMLEGDYTKAAGLYFLQMEDKIKKAMEEKKEKQKLYGAVSILSGLFLVILLL